MRGEALTYELILRSFFYEVISTLCEELIDPTLPKLKLIVLDLLNACRSEGCSDLLSSRISYERSDSSCFRLNGLSSNVSFFDIGTAEPPNLGLTIYLNFKEKAGSLLAPKK